jgi:outer membrane protein assembly factor BamE (lipoprotein component of BamABCDE complex)
MRHGSTIAAIALLLAGCAAIPRADSVRPGDSTAQVRERLGAPTAERTLAGGEAAWYYVTGPAGFETWRVVFAPGGAVKEYRQVLDMASFEWMRSGATRDEVLDRVGPPMQRMRFAGTQTEAWSYRWRDVTLEMIGEPVFEEKTGKVAFVGIFRDPAYSSTAGSQR